MQKRLILSNLCQLYPAFEEEYSMIQNCFLKFCSLRRKWHVIEGAAGTQYICLCLINQNVKLLVDALSNITSYKALLKLIGTDRCTLMIHSAPVRECIDILVCAVKKLCSHSFWDSLHAKLNSHYEVWSYKKKKHKKIKAYTRNLFRKTRS